MRLILAFTTLLLLHSTLAHAGVTCTRVGNNTYCRDDGGGSTTCTRIGSTTYCN